MFGYFLDFLSMMISAVVPIYFTWKTLQTRKTRPLGPLAKYWTIFGVMTVLESVANMLYLPYMVPGYSFIKFVGVLYVCSSGYDRIFKEVLSPVLKNYEPTGARFLDMIKQVGPQMISTVVNYLIDQVVISLNRNVVAYNEVRGRLQSAHHPAAVHYVEIQDESDEEYIVVE